MGQDLYKGERCRFPLTGLQLLVNGEDDISQFAAGGH